MKEVIRYQWKTLWLGKMVRTRYHATEEDIKKHHPEAVRVEGTRQVLRVPESEEELDRVSWNRGTGFAPSTGKTKK